MGLLEQLQAGATPQVQQPAPTPAPQAAETTPGQAPDLAALTAQLPPGVSAEQLQAFLAQQGAGGASVPQPEPAQATPVAEAPAAPAQPGPPTSTPADPLRASAAAFEHGLADPRTPEQQAPKKPQTQTTNSREKELAKNKKADLIALVIELEQRLATVGTSQAKASPSEARSRKFELLVACASGGLAPEQVEQYLRIAGAS